MLLAGFQRHGLHLDTLSSYWWQAAKAATEDGFLRLGLADHRSVLQHLLILLIEFLFLNVAAILVEPLGQAVVLPLDPFVLLLAEQDVERLGLFLRVVQSELGSCLHVALKGARHRDGLGRLAIRACGARGLDAGLMLPHGQLLALRYLHEFVQQDLVLVVQLSVLL